MNTNTIFRSVFVVAALLLRGWAGHASQAEEVVVNGRRFTIPDGYELDVVAPLELTKRPIVVDFDEQGNLYVAESSGTNDNVQTQLAEKPHSILKLSDTDGDGVFDQKTVFADRMMFPEGTLWHAGSLYVSAPPQIWKLTDTTNDGVADQREVWFDAKTLTGCANDLHGPYLGPDGWIYWCKGAFAEQAYQRPDAAPWVTRAAHIFRRRPEGGTVEPVMTGGMDNPVDVVFSEVGERFFTTTFFQHPANGQRDGLVHAIYGGVYGKRHGVLDGHPRTGDLMPVMTHLGAAAPCGFTRLESNALGFRNQLISACFNLHSVQRHRLVPQGASFTTEDAELVATEDIDFHPTDVIEDADGSLLIVDTGGWYKLCCPTSQLHKPEVLGSIYRLKKRHARPLADARGQNIDWQQAHPEQLVELLGDPRFVVRRRAIAQLGEVGQPAVPALEQVVAASSSAASRTDSWVVRRQVRNAVWAACRINDPSARSVVRRALNHDSAEVRQVAAHAVSVWRDRLAVEAIQARLQDPFVGVRRAVAEALGRIGDENSVGPLLSAIRDLAEQSTPDRALEHSLIYALLEIQSPQAIKQAFDSDSVAVVRAGLLAAGAMQDIELTEAEMCGFLSRDDFGAEEDSTLQRVITELAAKYPQWGDSYAMVLKTKPQNAATARQACQLTGNARIRQLIRQWLESPTAAEEFQVALVQELSRDDFADAWEPLVNQLLTRGSDGVVAATVQRIATEGKPLSPAVEQHLVAIAQSGKFDVSTRLAAIQGLPEIDRGTFDFALKQLLSDDSVQHRNQAATALSNLKMTSEQFSALADAHRHIGPLELGRTIDVFAKQTDPALGKRLLQSLGDNPSAVGLAAERVRTIALQFGDNGLEWAAPLLEQADVTLAEKSSYLDRLLNELPQGDLRQGHHVFHSKKAACFACHALGYRGGQVGPDLSRIAQVRTRRDLLESIVYPSASFVRSFEPFSVLTKDGLQLTGIVNNQTEQGVVLQCSATERQTVKTEDIESMVPSRVSIMPAGIEKQLSAQELADLLAFLESRK